ncbi:hypothetical protein PMI02_01943, partial [Novosphingobium sp. AP12]
MNENLKGQLYHLDRGTVQSKAGETALSLRDLRQTML